METNSIAIETVAIADGDGEGALLIPVEAKEFSNVLGEGKCESYRNQRGWKFDGD